MFISRLPGYLLAAIRFIVVTSSMAVTVGIGWILFRSGLVGQEFAFKVRTAWCKFALIILGIRIQLTGKPDLRDGNLFVGNHRSLIDPLVAFRFIPHGYVVSKAEVSSYPVVSTGAKLSGVIFVERDNSHSRRSTRELIEEALRQGKSVLIFPEGTISTGNTALQFRKGSFEAAATTGRSVIPFALEMGDPRRDFWYVDGLLHQYFITFSKWRTIIYLHFFEPLSGDHGEELCSRCQQMINNKLEEFQKNWRNQY